MENRRCIILFLAGILFCRVSLFGQPSLVNQQFDNYLRLLSPEKVYLHTDREVYNVGDTIWFRGYLKNASDLAVYPECNYLYVELFSAKWERNLQNVREESVQLRKRVKIKRGKNGVFSGYLPLSDDLNSGIATIRVYSYWMLNWDPAYMFSKDIEIRNPMKDAFLADLIAAEYTNQQTYDEWGLRNPFRKIVIRKKVPENGIDLRFLPESGRYLYGQKSVMAVKAVNQEGFGVKVKGIVKGESNQILASFETNDLGMGAFLITVPKGTSSLRAEVMSVSENYSVSAKVPLPEKSGIVLHVSPDFQGITIRVSDMDFSFSSSCYMVIYNENGIVLQSPYSECRSGKRVPYHGLAPGINHVVVIDDSGRVYAERPFFVFPEETVYGTFSFDKPKYGKREPVSVTIQLQDKTGRPLDGHFSLSVTDGVFAPASFLGHSIESWMLLGSEFQGMIEEPQRYFDSSRSLQERISDMELLLLTQGWRYYKLDEILQKRSVRPQFGKEYTQSLSGHVKGLWGKRKSVLLSFVAPKIGYSQIAEIDSTSYFSLNNLDFPEGTQFIVGAQGTGKVLKKQYLPILDPEYFAGTGHFVNYLKYKGYDDEYSDLARRSYAAAGGDIVYTLAPARIESQRYRLSPYPDDTFSASQYRDEKSLQPYAQYDLWHYIEETCPEVRRNADARRDDRLQTSGRTSFFPGQKMVNIYLNGVPVEVKDLIGIRVADVKAFVYITGLEAAKYDVSSAAAGFLHYPPVILIAARYPARIAPNITAEQPLGWQLPAGFYAPKYESALSKRSFEPMRSTLHWEPEVRFQNGKAHVTFFSSDHSAPWVFVLEGMTGDGQPVFFTFVHNE